jgi:adenylate cyclase
MDDLDPSLNCVGLLGDLSAQLLAKARVAGISEADFVGLEQAYARGIGRIVSAEAHLMARATKGMPRAEREEWARRWLAELTPVAAPAFESMHGAQLSKALQEILDVPNDQRSTDLAVAFVDLCGSSEYMLAASRDEIRGLVDSVFFASRNVAERYDVRVSKHLGDGVLLVGPRRREMIEAVTELVSELPLQAPLPAAAGVDFGTVTTRAGDHFGPPLNLAARLAQIASPREVLVAAAAVPDPPPRGTWNTRAVRSVAEPQRILRLTAE